MYDFIVVANARSGSHLLASFLTSHPDICCLDNRGRDIIPNRVPSPDLNKFEGLKGRIYSYPEFLKVKPESPKIIHLVRNIDRHAFSCARHQQLMSKVRPKLYRPHLEKGDKTDIMTMNFKANKSDIERITKTVLLNRKLVIEELMSREGQVLDLRYEHMTRGNQSVSEMPPYMSEIIARFLGVEPLKMTTGMIKIAPDEVKVRR